MIQRPAFAETPRQALELRRKALSWWSADGERAGYRANFMRHIYPTSPRARYPVGSREHDQFIAATVAAQQAILRTGDLYLVSDEMAEVARAAAVTLPSFVLEKEDFPSTSGLLIFHHSPCIEQAPGGEVSDLVGASWWMGGWGDQYGAIFQWYEDRDGGSIVLKPGEDEADKRAFNAQVLPKLMPASWTSVPLGEDFEHVRAPMLRMILSAFLLMQQPLAGRESARAAPMDHRRARRAGIQDSNVTVVRLRHLKNPSGTDVVRPREYRHRWLVRGHWRNQWLPSRGVHRPTWISPHVKGPEHAPIKVTEKVNVWSR